jgi:hypothetical protein
LKNYIKLNVSLLYWLFVAPFTGRTFKLAPIFRQMVFIGVRAAPMVALTAFSIGVTLAMQAAHSLQQLGAEIYVPDLVMVSMLREMGPVLIAVIVIGRSGSAVAAELGTMKSGAISRRPAVYRHDDHAAGANHHGQLHRCFWRLGGLPFRARFQHCRLCHARFGKRRHVGPLFRHD